MSGSKNSDWEIYTSSSSSSSADNGEVLGQALLAMLAIPVGAAVLTYYAGKVLVKGTVAGGKLAAKGVERYQEYQRQQTEIRLQKLEQRRVEKCNELRTQIDQASTYCSRVTRAPFMNDNWTNSAISDVQAIASQFNSSLSLEKALELSQSLKKTIDSIKTREESARRCQNERAALLSQLEQTRTAIESQSALPAGPELAKLDDFRSRINASTVETFPAVKAEFASWTIALMNRTENIQQKLKAQSIIESLWNSLPVSPELAQSYDSAGFAELKRIESSILSGAQLNALSRFEATFQQHKFAVETRMKQEAELEAQRNAIRKTYEPKLDEMIQRLELADNEIVNRWAGSKLTNLRKTLENFKTNLAQGNFQTMDSDLDAWNESYTAMLTDAGLKQQAEERRQYLVEALKTELPKMGFDIQSLASQADAASDTIIKVVPHVQKCGARQRITITVPQSTDKPVNYKFDGYDLKRNRVEGKPIVENDTGKQTVIDIAAALKPYGISMSAPDWSGNPDKIQKNANSLPGDNNPAEELDYTQSAAQTRSMKMDF